MLCYFILRPCGLRASAPGGPGGSPGKAHEYSTMFYLMISAAEHRGACSAAQNGERKWTTAGTLHHAQPFPLSATSLIHNPGRNLPIPTHHENHRPARPENPSAAVGTEATAHGASTPHALDTTASSPESIGI